MISPHPCPVCQNVQNNCLQDQILNVFICASCNHVFSESIVDAVDIYNPDYFLIEHKNWFLYPNIELFGKIESFIKDNSSIANLSVLDVGCGRGDLLNFLHKDNPLWCLSGIDISENKGQDIIYISGNFSSYEFGEKFNIITGLMVIEHVVDPVLFVRKLFDVLYSDGKVFLVTINSDSVMYRLANILRRLGWRAPYERLYHHHHLQHFNNASLRNLMEKNGFNVIKQYNHNFPFSAIDVPSVPLIFKLAYKYVIIGLFIITNFFGGGVNQTIVCKKNI